MQLSGLAQLIVITTQALFVQLIVNLKLCFPPLTSAFLHSLFRFLTVVAFIHGVFCLLKVLLILIGATASRFSLISTFLAWSAIPIQHLSILTAVLLTVTPANMAALL